MKDGELFGTTQAGEAVRRFTIRGGGLSANILNWGAVIQDLRLAGHDAPHTRPGAHRCNVDRHDPGIRMRTAIERDVEHARQVNVVHVTAAADQQPLRVRTRQRLADIAVGTIHPCQRAGHSTLPADGADAALRLRATSSIALTMAS